MLSHGVGIDRGRDGVAGQKSRRENDGEGAAVMTILLLGAFL